MRAYSIPFLITKEDVTRIKEETIGQVCKNRCSGSGALIENSEIKDCECLEDFKKKVLLVQIGIPRKYWNFSFDHLAPEFAKRNKLPLNILKKYCARVEKAAKEGIGLYIQGSHGLAKTSLSYLVLMEAIKKDVLCYATSMSKLSKLLFKVDDADSIELIDWIKKDVQLLVIDEIEKDYRMDQVTTFLGAQVNDFFRVLYDNKKAIIITSNVTKNQLREDKTHADNVVDRFEELIDVILTGNSYRKQEDSLKALAEDDE